MASRKEASSKKPSRKPAVQKETSGPSAESQPKALAFDEIVAVLDRYHPDPAIPLDHQNSYSFLVAVLLSAQCTDQRVNQVTAQLWAHGASPQAMVALGVPGIAQCIRSLGLYQRKAEHIYQLSQILIDKFQGQVPQTREALESLPGVGRKTASVILSHIYKEHAFPVDTHIMRLAKRWGWSSAETPLGVERDLCALFEPETWEKRHLQLIYFGRSHCKARQHQPEDCPACSLILKAQQET